jgi:hypothetical protein
MIMFGRRYPTLALASIALALNGGGLQAQQPAAQASAAQRRQHILAREQWQLSGRRLPGVNSAARAPAKT